MFIITKKINHKYILYNILYFIFMILNSNSDQIFIE